MNRNLDGIYFRIERDNKWQNICFSDLTKQEMQNVLLGKDFKYLSSLCCILGQTIKGISEQLGLEGDNN